MKRYMIEREMPGVGGLDRAQLKKIAAKSKGVLAGLPEKYSGSTRSSRRTSHSAFIWQKRRTRHSAFIWQKMRIWFLSTRGWAGFPQRSLLKPPPPLVP